MPLQSANEVAASLGAHPATIRRWCRELDVKKVGRDFVIDDHDFKRIKEALHEGPGRPWPKD